MKLRCYFKFVPQFRWPPLPAVVVRELTGWCDGEADTGDGEKVREEGRCTVSNVDVSLLPPPPAPGLY